MMMMFMLAVLQNQSIKLLKPLCRVKLALPVTMVLRGQREKRSVLKYIATAVICYFHYYPSPHPIHHFLFAIVIIIIVITMIVTNMTMLVQELKN